MPFARTDDGVRLHWEETGSGTPILFVHEFAGDHRSWEPQMRWFGRTHRSLAYAARGYPPSDVPDDVARYSQERAVEDAIAVLDAAGVERAHVVGLSMGGFCTLHLGLRRPERALSLVIAGCGYGSQPEHQATWAVETDASARSFETLGQAATVDRYMLGPARLPLRAKDPRAWAESRDWMAQHSPVGSALTLRGVQMRRPSLYALEEPLRALRLPALVMTGDEDEGCLEPNVFLKRTIPTASLAVLPGTGHAVNLEEPALFNRLVGDFLALVEAGRWTAREPVAPGGGLTGMAAEAAGA